MLSNLSEKPEIYVTQIQKKYSTYIAHRDDIHPQLLLVATENCSSEDAAEGVRAGAVEVGREGGGDRAGGDKAEARVGDAGEDESQRRVEKAGYVGGGIGAADLKIAAPALKLLQHAQGGLAFTVSLLGWYLFLVLLLTSVEFPSNLPVSDLSRCIQGASEKKYAV